MKLIGITNASQQAGINGGLAIWNLIVATTAAQFVERLGRRPLWLIGNAGMLAAFAIVTGLSVSDGVINATRVDNHEALKRLQGSFAAVPNTSVGTAVIPFLYIFYGFYDIAWTVLPNLCECDPHRCVLYTQSCLTVQTSPRSFRTPSAQRR